MYDDGYRLTPSIASFDFFFFFASSSLDALNFVLFPLIEKMSTGSFLALMCAFLASTLSFFSQLCFERKS